MLPLATSVDGRHFVCQASAHGLTLRTGGYVAIETDGVARLGQIVELELVEVDGPELASSAFDDSGTSVAANVRVRAVRGSGVILDGDGAPFHDGIMRPATSKDVEAWLERVRPRRAALEIGELRLAAGVPCLSMPAASIATASCADSPDRARRTRSASSSSSSCSRRPFGSSSSIPTPTSWHWDRRVTTSRTWWSSVTRPTPASSSGAPARRTEGFNCDSRISIRARRRLCSVSIRSRIAASTRRSCRCSTAGVRPEPPSRSSGSSPMVETRRGRSDSGYGTSGSIAGASGRVASGSIVDQLATREARCLVVDLGSLATLEEKAVVAEAVLATLWRQRADRAPTLIVIDEAHNVCPSDPDDPITAIATEHAVRIAAGRTQVRPVSARLDAAPAEGSRAGRVAMRQPRPHADELPVRPRSRRRADSHSCRRRSSLRATDFGLGDALVAGKIVSHPAYRPIR